MNLDEAELDARRASALKALTAALVSLGPVEIPEHVYAEVEAAAALACILLMKIRRCSMTPEGVAYAKGKAIFAIDAACVALNSERN